MVAVDIPEDGKSEHLISKGRRGRQAKPLVGSWWSVDPGQVHVGLAMWDDEELVDAHEVSPNELLALLAEHRPPLVVIEAFSLRSPRWTNAQASQAVDTVKLVGGVEALCFLAGSRIVEQQPSVRHVAQRSPYWKDLKVPANGHVRSAVAHGLYFMRFAKR